MIKRILLGTSVILGTLSAFAQQTHVCGTDEHSKALQAQHPEFKIAEAQAKQAWEAYKISGDYKAALAQNKKKSGAPKYIIPVVVHVFYASPGASDNISNAQVQSEIDFLNKSFRNLNADSTNRRTGVLNGNPFDFKETAGDAEIEFRLARKDPNGNCTNGIVRVQSSALSDGNDNLKKTSVWDTKRYFNIWVVKGINKGSGLSVAGYAQFPFYAGGAWSALTDGVMVINEQFGMIGTAAPNPNDSNETPFQTTTTHEAGHWLGLYHPFQAVDSCEVQNDGVDDTPPTYFNPSTTEPLRNRCNKPLSNTCLNDRVVLTLKDTVVTPDSTYYTNYRDTLVSWDRPDMQENFMDYFNGSCASNMFTKQQIARMHQSIELYRRQLVSAENMIATGVTDPVTACAPTPAFGITINSQPAYERQVCVGTVMNFADLSYNGTATTYEWNFGEGATPQTSTDKNPANVSYSTPGLKTITFKVGNANGENAKTFTNALNVTQPAVINYAAFNPDYPMTTDGWELKGDAIRQWQVSGGGVFSGEKSILLRGNSSGMYGSLYSIVSPSFDLSAASAPYIKFNYAFAPNTVGTATSSDNLGVQYSTNCGLNWISLRTVSGATLSTVVSPLNTFIDFIPVNAGQWKELTVSGTTVPKQPNVRFRITFSNEGGNNLYLDNFIIGQKVGLDELTAKDISLNVYPNPFNTSAQISYSLPAAANTTIEVYDIVGKKVASLFDGKQTEGMQTVNFDRTAFGLSNGMYFIKVKVGESVITQKVLVN